MSARNDTVPDRPRDAADTDPTSARHDTDPTWPGPPPASSDDVETPSPSPDHLLDGIAARPAAAPRTMAESAGEDAARYATLAAPVRGHQPAPVPASGVIFANTEPLPIAVALQRTSDESSAAPIEIPPGPRAPAARRGRHVTTVPGLRQRRGARALVGAALIATLAVVLTIALRVSSTTAPPSPPPATSTISTASAEATSASTTPLRDPSLGVTSAPATAAASPAPASNLHDTSPPPPASTSRSAPAKSGAVTVRSASPPIIAAPALSTSPAATAPKHDSSPKDDGSRIY